MESGAATDSTPRAGARGDKDQGRRAIEERRQWIDAGKEEKGDSSRAKEWALRVHSFPRVEREAVPKWEEPTNHRNVHLQSPDRDMLVTTSTASARRKG